MTSKWKFSVTSAVAGLVLTTGLAFAQDNEDPDISQVLATVNGVEITLGHVIAARTALPAQYDQMTSALL